MELSIYNNEGQIYNSVINNTTEMKITPVDGIKFALELEVGTTIYFHQEGETVEAYCLDRDNEGLVDNIWSKKVKSPLREWDFDELMLDVLDVPVNCLDNGQWIIDWDEI